MSDFDKGIRGLVNPGYRTPEEIAREKNEEFFQRDCPNSQWSEEDRTPWIPHRKIYG